ncbi:MAG: DUF3467 domain-containing protein [Candidatus Methylomirabilota bacterium]
MRTVHANAWNVVVSPSEIAVLFGVEGEWDNLAGEVAVRLSDRILLHPRAAKRLARALREAVRQHEARFGPAEPPAAPNPIRAAISQDDVLPGPATAEAVGRVEALLAAVRGLRADFGLEQSFKLSRATLEENRFLVTLAKRTIERPEERILRVCDLLGMPEGLREVFAARLPAANYLHVGFEEGVRGSLYKMYLEFWTDWEREIDQRPMRHDPFELHLGFKWDPTDAARRAVSTYTCHPRIAPERIRERIAGLFDPGAHSGSLAAALDIVARAAAGVGREQLLYLEVSESESPRRSFDLNVYKANLRLGDFGEPLRRLCAFHGVPPERLAALYARAKHKRLGHVSGGIDRTGRDFLTIYYGMRGLDAPRIGPGIAGVGGGAAAPSGGA